MDRPSSEWRLSDRGREQAKAAGVFIRACCATRGVVFQRHYTSEYVRAMETAAFLGLPSAVWFTEFYLRERDLGELDGMTDDDRKRLFAEQMRRRESNRFFWSPPGGESLAEVCLRIDRFLDTLHRECEGRSVIVVCHSDVMWAFRIRLERMPYGQYSEFQVPERSLHHHQNGHVLHYTRRSPYTDELEPYLGWIRSVCPWDQKLSTNDWRGIVRARYTNEDLMVRVNRVPRLVEE